MPNRPAPKGRGSPANPPGRFGLPLREADLEHDQDLRPTPTEFLRDHSRSVVTENDSPDVLFRFSLNPYRGCEHGCPYCFARPTHEYLGLNAGWRRFLLDPTPADAVSAPDAADFSKFLVEECSRRSPLLDGSPYLIGPTCDVVVVGEGSVQTIRV